MCTVYGDVVTVHTTRDLLDVMIRSADKCAIRGMIMAA